MSRVTVDFLYKPLQALFSSIEFRRAVKKYAKGASITTFPTFGDFPGTGDETTIYLAVDTNKIYYWDGSAYVEMSPGVGVSEFNTRTGAITLLSSDVTAALGYTPVTNGRTLTINGVTYDLSSNRSWTVSGLPTQTGNSGKYLTTDGTSASWVTLSTSNIYSADGSLTGNRTVTMGSYTLTFEKDITINGVRIGKGTGDINTNTTVGYQAGTSSTGTNNTTLGYRALASNTTGDGTIAIGSLALYSNSTGLNNVAIGYSALYSNTNSSNLAIGISAMYNNTSGNTNVAIGNSSLYNNVSGVGNVAVGLYALINSTGNFNTVVGNQSGTTLTGSNNIIVGYGSTPGITFGSNNVIIGSTVTGLSTSLSNNIILADGAGNQRLVFNSSGNAVLGGAAYPSSFTYKLDVLGTGRYSGKLAVGNPTQASAFLEVSSTTQGFLPPRMTTTERNAISSPAAGLIVYDTSLNAVYYYNGTAWTTSASSGGGGSTAASSLFNYYNFI